jgi:SAM-dependent methyltransferase
MIESKAATSPYVLGHSETEVERLKKQSQLFIGDFTERCLRDAGIQRGMKVLDVGSGAGDVAMVVAEKVGPEGQVIGVDLSQSVLETARQRASAAGYNNITFLAGDIQEVELDNDFDAIVGRLIFFHLREPVKVLRRLLNRLKPGGLVVFQDYDITPAACYPPSPLFEQAISRIMEGFRRGGADPQIGMKLPKIFREAGLPEPELRCEASISTSPDWAGYDQLAGVTRTLLPLILKTGLATAEEIQIETLAERLRADLIERGGVGRGPDVISAWTRKAR